jgi:protein TonB
MRGRGTVPVLVFLLVAAGAAVTVHVLQRRNAAEHAGRSAVAAVPATTAERPANPAMSMGHAQLLAAASHALAEHRLLAPAGDNAFAYYLEARKRQAHHPVAAAALRELFPFAVQSAEQSIDAGHLDEAQREIALLDRADPTNYSLNILRAKLEAQRRLAETTTAAEQPKPTHPAPHPPAPPPARVASEQASTVANQPKHTTPPTPAPVPVPVAKTRPVAHEVERTPPLLLRDVQPAYPSAARRAHRQGWVEVSYTVDREGKVVDARVVDAHPTHVFDVAALSAVRHWEFRPARVNGQAVPQKVRSRIEFKL